MHIDRRKFLFRATSLGIAAAAGELAAPTPRAQAQATRAAAVINPYEGISNRTLWLKGEIHTHIGAQSEGPDASTVYRAAAAAKLDFVGMSLEVTEANGGAHRFADVAAAESYGVIGIPAREIQNNLYGQAPYFHDAGAEFLHVLTVGRRGVSICAHPRFYDMIEGRTGSWSGIRSALLNPQPGENLNAVNVTGLEIFNGYTLKVLKERAQEADYADYDEACWDEVLMGGRLCWGFASNDAFVGGHDYAAFSPLGCIHVAARERTAAGILDAARQGRFYASTGVTLPANPIAIARRGGNIRIAVAANGNVDWMATICRREGNRWSLERRPIVNARRANFTIPPQWKYVRIRCRSVQDPWQRAWLQPIVNPALFAAE